MSAKSDRIIHFCMWQNFKSVENNQDTLRLCSKILSNIQKLQKAIFWGLANFCRCEVNPLKTLYYKDKQLWYKFHLGSTLQILIVQ